MNDISNYRHKRLLSAEGEQEFGHIFTDGYVPVVRWTPIEASLRGISSLVFLVDWEALSASQQDQVIDYMVSKFDDSIPDQIRRAISGAGHFPIQWKYVIESYDMRFLM